MTDRERIVITGMAVNTPLSDTLDGFLAALLAGRSAITRWRAFDTTLLLAKIGGDLSGYDTAHKIGSHAGKVPDEIHARLRRLCKKAPWGTQLSVLLALDAWRDADCFEAPPDMAQCAVIAAGHGFASRYSFECGRQFAEDPDYMDPLHGLYAPDPDPAARVSELLGAQGFLGTVGGACASGNLALRPALHELRHGGAECAVVFAPVLDFSPIDYQGMALIGAAAVQKFNDEPERASRPWDVRREGFVPAHGGAALVLEPLSLARQRGARIYAEIAAVAAGSDACHLPEPSEEGQARVIAAALRESGIAPEQIDYVNAHATSTPVGDVREIRSLKRVLGAHASRVKINATKSMLGHTLWAAPMVETIASVLQMRAGMLHPTINVEQLDPEVDLDVCANHAVRHDVRWCLKNSFGFGGINCVSVLRRYDD